MAITWLEFLPEPGDAAEWHTLDARLADVLPPLTAGMSAAMADDAERGQREHLTFQLLLRYGTRPHPPAVAAYLAAFFRHR